MSRFCGGLEFEGSLARRGFIPIKFPAETIEKVAEETARINMEQGAFTGDDTFEITGTVGGEVVGGLVGFALGAVARNDEARISDSADEGYTFLDELLAAFKRVEGEVELVAEIRFDDGDVADELFALGERDDDVEVIDVATVMFVAEIVNDETVELIEKDIGDELASEITNYDTTTGAAIKKTFVRREGGPIGFGAADDDAAHRIVVNDLMPDEFSEVVEAFAVERVTEDAILLEIVRRELVERGIEAKLTIETPSDAFVELLVIEADEVALNVERDGESRLSEILSGAANVLLEALLTKKYAFVLATGIRIDDEAAIPPVGAEIIEEMVNHAVAKWCSDDLTDDGIVDDESDAAAGLIMMMNHALAEGDDVFHVVELETVLVDSIALAFAGGFVGAPELDGEKFAETLDTHDSVVSEGWRSVAADGRELLVSEG